MKRQVNNFLTDVIFNGSSSGNDADPEKVSKQVLKRFQGFFNELEFKTLTGLRNYRNFHGRSPTYKELAVFMGEKPGNIQPRLSELRDSQAVVVDGKRPCTESDHGTSVSTFKLADWVKNQ